MSAVGRYMETVLPVLLACTPAVCLSGETDKLITTAQLEKTVRQHEIPGIGVCVVNYGRVVQVEVVGERKAGSGNFMQDTDLFHIGSCTKFMTVCLAQIAVEEGRLKWDASLGALGDRLRVPVDPLLQTITLDELVTCTAGFPEDRGPAAWPDGLLTRLYSFNTNPRDGRRLLAKVRLENAGGVRKDGKYRYSNLGFCLAGIFIEEAYDRPFEDLMREKLFTPLGMASAGFGAPVWIDSEDQPWGHRDGRPASSGQEADNPQAIGPAGTVHMNLQDMGRYLLFMLGHEDVLSQPIVRRLLQPSSNADFARGWTSTECEWANGTVWIATGSNTQFFTMFLVAPEIDFAIAVSVNSGDDAASKACQDVTNGVVERLQANNKRSRQ